MNHCPFNQGIRLILLGLILFPIFSVSQASNSQTKAPLLLRSKTAPLPSKDTEKKPSLKRSNSDPTGLKYKTTGEDWKLPTGRSIWKDQYDISVQDLPGNIQMITLNEDVFYSFNYDGDDINFVGNILEVKGRVRSGERFPLTNMHGATELNIFKRFDPVRDKGKRSFSWAIPYDRAISYEGGLKKLGDSHEQSALLRDWSGGSVRQFVSFILIPPGSTVKYKIGFAAPQNGKGQGAEERGGYGMQMRLAFLPAGTLIFTISMLTGEEENKGTWHKESKKFDLPALLKKVLEEYRRSLPEGKLPEEFNALVSKEDYVGPLAQGVNVNDPEALSEYYVDRYDARVDPRLF